MDDDDDAIKQFKWFAVAFAIFLMCGYFSLTELRYFLFGAKTEASVVEAFETEHAGRRGRGSPVYAVRYSFDDNGTTRTERDDLPMDSVEPLLHGAVTPGSKVTVQYLPGSKDKSRVLGHASLLPVVVFVIVLAGIVGFAVWLWRHAYQQVHGPRRRRR